MMDVINVMDFTEFSPEENVEIILRGGSKNYDQKFEPLNSTIYKMWDGTLKGNPTIENVEPQQQRSFGGVVYVNHLSTIERNLKEEEEEEDESECLVQDPLHLPTPEEHILPNHPPDYRVVQNDNEMNECDACGKCFPTPGQLTLHTQPFTQRALKLGVFNRCNSKGCGRTYGTPCELSGHRKVHVPPGLSGRHHTECDVCGRNCPRTGLTVHGVNEVNGVGVGQNLICGECGGGPCAVVKKRGGLGSVECQTLAQFATGGNGRKTKKETRHKCGVCGQDFKFTFDLNRHKTTHIHTLKNKSTKVAKIYKEQKGTFLVKLSSPDSPGTKS